MATPTWSYNYLPETIFSNVSENKKQCQIQSTTKSQKIKESKISDLQSLTKLQNESIAHA